MQVGHDQQTSNYLQSQAEVRSEQTTLNISS